MKYLRRSSVAAVLLSGSLLMTSCDTVRNANDTQKGAAIGAVGGALLGGLVAKNNRALGAILGAAVGGTAGGLIGHKMDKQAQEISTALPGAEVQRVGEGIKVILHENTVNFAFDSANLTQQAQDNLNKLVPVFKQNPETNVTVYGYTDSVGKPSYNLGLSERRANSVISYLVANGLDRSRFKASGMGEADPVASNDTDAGRAQNRRVEFAITANQQMVNEAKQGQ